MGCRVSYERDVRFEVRVDVRFEVRGDEKKNPWWHPFFFNGLWSPLTFLARQWLFWKFCWKIESYFFLDLKILFLSKLVEWKNFKIFILGMKCC